MLAAACVPDPVTSRAAELLAFGRCGPPLGGKLRRARGNRVAKATGKKKFVVRTGSEVGARHSNPEAIFPETGFLVVINGLVARVLLAWQETFRHFAAKRTLDDLRHIFGEPCFEQRPQKIGDGIFHRPIEARLRRRCG